MTSARKPFLFVLLLLLPLGAHAQRVLHVDLNATGQNDGTSWADAFPSLQDALAAAEAGDELWVATGTYHPDQGQGITPGDRAASFVLKDSVAVYGGFAGIETSREERDWEVNETVLSGDLLGNDNDNVVYDEPTRSDNSYHVVLAEDVETSTVLDGFTVTAGNASESARNSLGAGIFSDDSRIVLRKIVVRFNTAARNGAGMYSSGDSLSLANMLFEQNKSGLGGLGSEGPFTGRGGGLFLYFGSPFLDHVTFRDNEAGDGGGLYNQYGNLVFSHGLFTGNEATIGGGMMDRGPNRTTLVNVRFLGNEASIQAGGLIAWQSSTRLVNTLFSGNHSDIHGGALYNDSPIEVILTNVVFTGNTARVEGAAIYNEDNPLIIQNSVLWGNTVTEGGDPIYVRDSSMPPFITHSIVEGGIPEDAIDGGNNLSDDPLFVDPDGPDDLPGTLDDDFCVMLGSSTIDAGDNDALPADSLDLDQDGNLGEPIPIDLVGNMRTFSADGGMAVVDIGVCEFGAPPVRTGFEILKGTRHDNGIVIEVYPNPFHLQTTLLFRLKRASYVQVGLYDVLGRRRLLLYEGVPAGDHEHVLMLNGKDLPSGLYLIRLTGNNTYAVRPVIITR